MVQVPGRAAVKFQLHRDRWDTVDFYLVLWGAGLLGGLYYLGIGSAQLSRDLRSGWGWFFFVDGLVGFLFGLYHSVLHVWRRFAESYELTETELIIEYGYARLRIPLTAIRGVLPVKICRTTTALKPGLKLRYSESKTRLQTVDISPSHQDVFLDELVARCPTLKRAGVRLVEEAASALASDRHYNQGARELKG
ncbi:MAG: PH domain-containing protein [Planctomycetales bacterium]